jgi:hypothetical protein
MAERRDAERAAEIARQAGIDDGTIRKREAAEKRKPSEIPHARNECFDSRGRQSSCAAGGRAAQVKAGVVSVAAPDHPSRAQKKVFVRKNVVLSSETHIAYPVATR